MEAVKRQRAAMPLKEAVVAVIKSKCNTRLKAKRQAGFNTMNKIVGWVSSSVTRNFSLPTGSRSPNQIG
jgi:hypothetical protein